MKIQNDLVVWYFVLFHFEGIDVILGLDSLRKNYAIIECKTKKIYVNPKGEKTILPTINNSMALKWLPNFFLNQSIKNLEDVKHITLILHSISPHLPTHIINKSDKISKTAKGFHVHKPTHFREHQLKNFRFSYARHDKGSSILFAHRTMVTRVN